VRDLPLNGRNWSTLTALAPGAVDTGRSNQRSIRFAGRGLDDNNFTFDGIGATNFVNQAQQSYVRLAIPTDAIQEFRIDTMLFIAENGSTPDGQADVVTAGCTDATSFAANGKHQLVIDWKSDVDPASETVEHYRVQVRNYLGTTGIENGLIAFGTSGTVVHVKASVIVEPIS
jgi:hypothetical protein